MDDNYLGELREAFFEHAVDGNRLVFLTKKNLEEMGIESAQMIDLIMKKVSELRFEQNIITNFMYPTDSMKKKKKKSTWGNVRALYIDTKGSNKVSRKSGSRAKGKRKNEDAFPGIELHKETLDSPGSDELPPLTTPAQAPQSLAEDKACTKAQDKESQRKTEEETEGCGKG